MITQTHRLNSDARLSGRCCVYDHLFAFFFLQNSSIVWPPAQTLPFCVSALHTDLIMERSEKKRSVDVMLKREQGEVGGSEEEVEVLDTEDEEEQGSTPLITACRRGRAEVCATEISKKNLGCCIKWAQEHTASQLFRCMCAWAREFDVHCFVIMLWFRSPSQTDLSPDHCSVETSYRWGQLSGTGRLHSSCQ